MKYPSGLLLMAQVGEKVLGVALTRRLESGLLALLVVALVWLPLPLGSNRPWAVALLALWLWGLLLAACLLRCLGAPLPLPAPSPHMPARRRDAVVAARTQRRLGGPQVWPVLLLALCNVWIGAQSLTPWGRTADLFASQVYLLKSLCCLAAFGCVLLLASDAERRKWLLLGVFGGGILQAVAAVALFSTSARYQYLGNDFYQGMRALGTFPNADHLANYMALTLGAGIALMLGQMGGHRTGPEESNAWRRGAQSVLEFMLSTKMMIRLLLVLLVITLVLTRSRMGNGAFFLALPVLAVVLGLRSQQLRKPALWLVASLLVVDIVVVGQWVGLEKVVQRLEATEVTVAQAEANATAAMATGQPRAYREETWEERLRATEDTLRMVQLRPWAGWGAGSFYAAFPSFKRDGLGHYDHTHCDYVEIAADIGLVGLGLLVAVFLLTLRRVWQLLTDDNSAQVRGLAAGVGVAMLCALLHGFVDFTLQIPANSVMLTVLLAMVWAAPVSPGSAAPAAAGSKVEKSRHQGNR